MLKDVKSQHLSLEVSIIFLYLCSEKDLNKPNIHPPLKERSRKTGGNTERNKICKKCLNSVGAPESIKIIIEASSGRPTTQK